MICLIICNNRLTFSLSLSLSLCCKGLARVAHSPSALRAAAKRILPTRIELPRRKIGFTARTDADGITRLYSLDHTNMFVPLQVREDVGQLLRGVPHSILLSNANDELHVLVPNVYVCRPNVGNAPFSTELVLSQPSHFQVRVFVCLCVCLFVCLCLFFLFFVTFRLQYLI